MRDDAVVPREVLLDRRLGNREKVVYALIRLHQDEWGARTDASLQSLVEMSGLNEELVTATLQMLESFGHISMWRILKNAPLEIQVTITERELMQRRAGKAV